MAMEDTLLIGEFSIETTMSSGFPACHVWLLFGINDATCLSQATIWLWSSLCVDTEVIFEFLRVTTLSAIPSFGSLFVQVWWFFQVKWEFLALKSPLIWVNSPAFCCGDFIELGIGLGNLLGNWPRDSKVPKDIRVTVLQGWWSSIFAGQSPVVAQWSPSHHCCRWLLPVPCRAMLLGRFPFWLGHGFWVRHRSVPGTCLTSGLFCLGIMEKVNQWSIIFSYQCEVRREVFLFLYQKVSCLNQIVTVIGQEISYLSFIHKPNTHLPQSLPGTHSHNFTGW